MIDLIIKQQDRWKSLDLTENPGFTITKQFADLQEPTDYFADYSKTVQIVKTKRNNEVLGSIFRLDVAQFDARKKIPFMILVNNAKMVSGVAKLMSVDKEYYNLQLSGEMADTFKTLRSLTFSEGSPYTIDNPLTPGLVIDRFLVRDSWNNTDPQTGLNNCRDVDIIGFCPTIHGLNNGFDSKSVVTTSNGKYQLTSIGKYINLIKQVDSGDTIVGEGLTERQMGDFRSYYQKPFIYINKLFQIFQRESERRCHYSLKLDRSWFNHSNRFYSRVVYMLPDLLNENATKNTTNTNLAPFKFSYSYPKTGKTDGIDQWNSASTTSSYDILKGYDAVISTTVDFSIRAANSGAITFDKTRIDPDNGIIIEAYAADAENGMIYSTQSILVHNSSTDLNVNDYDHEVSFGYVHNEPTVVDNPAYFEGSVPVTFGVRPNRPIKIGVRARFHNTSIPWQGKGLVTAAIHYNYWQAGVNRIDVSLNNTVLSTTASLRSGSPITMSRLWPEGKTIYDVIIQYCKLFGLIIYVDDNTETIKIMSRSSFFEDVKIEDWSDKIDMNSIEITPATLQERYLQFGYGDTTDEIAKRYETKYKVPYGSSTLDTENEFNNDTKTIFEDLTPSCIASESITTANNVLQKWLGAGYPVPIFDSKEVYPSNIAGGTSADCWGNFYFLSGSQQIDSNLGGYMFDPLHVTISDDDVYQVRNNAFCYTSISDSMLQVNTLPLISTLYSDKSVNLTLGTPKEQYCSSEYVNSGATDIYKMFHQRWFLERYNSKNKVLNADFYLNYLDILNFSFNKFIKIANNLYIVNKISDFDPSKTNTLTHVELLQVDDLTAYKADIFDPYIDVDRRNIKYSSGAEYVTVYSSSTWEFKPSAEWIRVTREGDRLRIVCASWPYPNARMGRVTINNSQGVEVIISISQRFAGGCEIYTDPNVWIVEAAGGARLFNVTSTNNWRIFSVQCLPVDAPNPKTWIYDGRLGVQVWNNESPISRTYDIELKNDCGSRCKLSIYQQGKPVSTGGGLTTGTTTITKDITTTSRVTSVSPIHRDYIDANGKKQTVDISDIQVTQDIASGGKLTVVLTPDQQREIEKLGGALVNLNTESGELISIPIKKGT